jgi:F-type H+-transporting ATPase subunit c
MNDLAFGLTYAIAGGLAAVGVGLVGAAAVGAVGRNPDAIGTIRTMMILAMSFVDALGIIGLVVALIIRFLG